MYDEKKIYSDYLNSLDLDKNMSYEKRKLYSENELFDYIMGRDIDSYIEKYAAENKINVDEEAMQRLNCVAQSLTEHGLSLSENLLLLLSDYFAWNQKQNGNNVELDKFKEMMVNYCNRQEHLKTIISELKRESDLALNIFLEKYKKLDINDNKHYTNNETFNLYSNLLDVIISCMPDYDLDDLFECEELEHYEKIDRIISAVSLSQDYEEFDDLYRNIKKHHGIIKAGIIGEDNIRTVLDLYSDKCKILYNYRFSQGTYCVEIDVLVITEKGLFCVEVKNWSGNCTVNEMGWLEENSKNKKRKSVNLAYQSKQHHQNLRRLLSGCIVSADDNNIHEIICFTNPKSKVVSAYPYIPVCYANEIDEYIFNTPLDPVWQKDDIENVYSFLRSHAIPEAKYPLNFSTKSLPIISRTVWSANYIHGLLSSDIVNDKEIYNSFEHIVKRDLGDNLIQFIHDKEEIRKKETRTKKSSSKVEDALSIGRGLLELLMFFGDM